VNRRRRGPALGPCPLAAAALLALAACSPPAPAAAPTARPAAPAASPGGGQIVYAALGASETAGIGTADPLRESFPQQLYARLGPSAVLYSFGQPGETTEAALRDELPGALAVHPTLATVWFNVDDLVAGVTVADYEARLDQLVGGQRRAGVQKVLVANTPHLDHLPAYAACRPDPPPGSPVCPLGALTLPPPDQIDALTQAYNAAVTRVVQREGATLVDLYASGEVPDQHPEYVSADGFHPSARGAAAIAATFAAAIG
jgi:lysophospholipase L1-like esterase